jgi:hypothetical protein
LSLSTLSQIHTWEVFVQTLALLLPYSDLEVFPKDNAKAIDCPGKSVGILVSLPVS